MSRCPGPLVSLWLPFGDSSVAPPPPGGGGGGGGREGLRGAEGSGGCPAQWSCLQTRSIPLGPQAHPSAEGREPTGGGPCQVQTCQPPSPPCIVGVPISFLFALSYFLQKQSSFCPLCVWPRVPLWP